MTGSITLLSLTVLLGTLLLAGCSTGSRVQPDAEDSAMRHFGLYGPSTQSDSEQTPAQSGLYQISFVVEGDCTDPSIDRRGHSLAFASNQHGTTHDIYVRPMNTRTVTRITSDTAEDVMPTFAPDGSQLAFASNRSGQYDIYTINLEGGRPTRLTSDMADEYHPSWSADGRYLAYSRTNPRTSRNEIWVLDLRQPGRTMFVDYGTMPEWSPDPADPIIVFQRARERGSRLYSIWTIDFNQDQPSRPTEIVSASNAAAINPTWSPDGRFIAFATVTIDEREPEADALDLWTVHRDGSQLQHMTLDPDDEYLPTWSIDGRIYFVSSRTGNSNIWSVATGHTGNSTDPTTQIAEIVPDDP